MSEELEQENKELKENCIGHCKDLIHKLNEEIKQLKQKLEKIEELDLHNITIPQSSESFRKFHKKQIKLKSILEEKRNEVLF